MRRIVFLLSVLTVATATAAEYANRRVSTILDELRAQGLIFIYNSEIVPAELRVSVEPRARAGIALASEILSGHSLGVSQVAPGVYAVVRLTSNPSASAQQAQPAVPAARSTLDEIVVLSSRYDMSTSTESKTFLTQEQVKSMPRLADETLRALQRLPGTSTNGFSSSTSIRGGEPNETAIVLDGLRLYEPFHLKNFLSPVSLLDSRLIHGIEFYSGGYPTMYGDRMSALVEATTIRPTQRRYYEAGVSLFHLNGLAAGELGSDDTRMLISARRSNAGYLAKLSESEFGTPNYSDGFVRLDHRLDDATRVSLQTLLSADKIDALKDSGTQRASAEYESAYTWATLEHDWSASANSRLILSYTDVSNLRQGQISDSGRRTAAVIDHRAFSVLGLRLDNTFNGNIFGLFEDELPTQRFGVEVRRLWADYLYASDVRYEAGYPFPSSPASSVQRAASPNPAGFESSAYWDARIKLTDRWSLQTGLRLDTQTYDSSGDGEQWSPRFGVLYAPNGKTELRVSWGRFFQSQGINELQVEDGVDRFFPAQHANHTIVSVNHAFELGVDLRVEAYRKDYRRLRPRFENLFSPLVLLPETEFDRVLIEPESARSEGVEFSIRLRPHGAWNGWLSYAWSRASDLIDGSYVRRSWDQTHAANLGVAWNRGPWSVTIADSYRSGWPSSELVVTPSVGGAPEQIEFGPRNVLQLGDYNSLDLRISRTFALRRGALDVYVEASNALSAENQCCVSYSPVVGPGGSVQLNRAVDNWLPLVPSGGVLWRY